MFPQQDFFQWLKFLIYTGIWVPLHCTEYVWVTFTHLWPCLNLVRLLDLGALAMLLLL